jgi:hypothetical protein
MGCYFENQGSQIFIQHYPQTQEPIVTALAKTQKGIVESPPQQANITERTQYSGSNFVEKDNNNIQTNTEKHSKWWQEYLYCVLS